MSARGGVVLSNSSVIGSTALTAVSWIGGRTSLVVCATQYGTGVNVQVQGPAPLGTWIPICSSIVSDQIFTFDAPQGSYRLVSAGSSIALGAVLVGQSYT